MERHFAQKMRINGITCDCGAPKHLLDIEDMAEESIPMVRDTKVYYRILDWVKKVGPKCMEKRAKTRLFDEEYPLMSYETRDFRKELTPPVQLSKARSNLVPKNGLLTPQKGQKLDFFLFLAISKSMETSASGNVPGSRPSSISLTSFQQGRHSPSLCLQTSRLQREQVTPLAFSQ